MPVKFILCGSWVEFSCGENEFGLYARKKFTVQFYAAKVKIPGFICMPISVQNTFSLEESLNIAPTRDVEDPVDCPSWIDYFD